MGLSALAERNHTLFSVCCIHSYHARNTRPLTARNCMWPLSLFCASCRCSCRQADRVTVQTGRQTDDRRPTRAVGAGGAVGTPHRGPSADAWPTLQQKQQSRPRRCGYRFETTSGGGANCQPESQVTSVGATAPLAVLQSCSSSSCNDTMDQPARTVMGLGEAGCRAGWLAPLLALLTEYGRAS